MTAKKTKQYIENPNIEIQLEENIKSYDYDTLEYPIEVIVEKYKKSLADNFDDGSQHKGSDNVIYVPDYQREFIWNVERKSKFIESILIGIPIPYFFFADVLGKLEIVDGSQRIRCLHEFIEGKLKLKGLEKLTELNGTKFDDLAPFRCRRFLNKGLKAILLGEKTDNAARLDLFERINTGSDDLNAAEVRKGAYAGEFWDFLDECAKNKKFIALCPISAKVGLRAEGTERILRFFAYSKSLNGYNGHVKAFLNKFMKRYVNNFNPEDKAEMQAKFEAMLTFVERNFPNGFKKFATANSAPRVRFEAIALGVTAALAENPQLHTVNVNWLDSEDFSKVTKTDAANNKRNLVDRIDFVKNKLLGAE